MFGGDVPKNGYSNYIGCIGDLHQYIIDYAVPGRRNRVRCKWKERKTGIRCITLLNDDNKKHEQIYCSMHQQKFSYELDVPLGYSPEHVDTPLATPKNSSNKKKPKAKNED